MNNPFVKPNTGGDLAFTARMKSGTFLVVDDFDSMRKVTISQLKQLGADKIIEAANGAEALKILARQPITMVLSDWNMPVMSGLDLLLTLRSDPKLCTLPFLMITAEAGRSHVMQAIRSGVSDLLVKPYTSAGLSQRIEKSLDWKPRQRHPINSELLLSGEGHKVTLNDSPVTPSEAGGSAAVSKKTGERPTILVVDDTPDNLTLLSSIFKEEYRVKIAHNGKKALSICHSDTPPDLILLDIMMPEMDGFEVAQQLRGHPSSEHIPVIFVTAMTGEEDRLKGMELGAVDFVTKPIDPVALKLRVKNFMRYVELHRQLQADYDEMMELDRLKEDVERITRHDMKGPLAGVISLAQGLTGATNLNAAQHEQMRMIEVTALQVLDMINLSNELFKIETGRFVLNPQEVQVAHIIRRIVELSSRTFAVKDLTIAVATPRGVKDDQLIAIGDSMLCYSLFQNLIKNACEAAPDNSTVTITIHNSTPMRITLETLGAVPAPIRETFFEKFATAGKQGGTGLGTYSAKLLTEAQKGTIAMESSDEKNQTCITLTLPAK